MLHKCRTIKQLKQVHLQMLINCMRSDDDDNINYSLLADKLMLLSSDLVSFDYAYRVFMYSLSNPSLASYNTLINCSVGKSDNIAASAYNRMRSNIISPDRFTFAFLLKSFTYSSCLLKSGKAVQGHVIKLGFVSDTFVLNSLLEFYFEFIENCNQLRAVRKVFDEMPERDVVSWNTMISGLGYRRLHFEAFSVFDDMLSDDHRCKPDETTLIIILFVCSQEKFMEQGKWLDSYIKENKYVLSVPLGNALIDMFVRFEDLGNATMVFKSMPKRCSHTWERMMSILIDKEFCKEALVLFDTMCCCSEEEEGGLKPDDDIFSKVLGAFYMDERLVGDGKMLFKAIHKMVHVFGVKPNRDHCRTMISILCKAGWVEAAMMLVESLPDGTLLETLLDYDMWGSVLFACQVHGNNLLLDSWIRKISDKKSKQGHSSCFMTSTLSSYVHAAFYRRHNDDVNYVKSMVETLIRKLPDQKHVEELNEYLERRVEENASIEAYNERHECSQLVHAPETLPPHENDDDVYKVVECLDRELLDIYMIR